MASSRSAPVYLSAASSESVPFRSCTALRPTMCRNQRRLVRATWLLRHGKLRRHLSQPGTLAKPSSPVTQPPLVTCLFGPVTSRRSDPPRLSVTGPASLPPAARPAHHSSASPLHVGRVGPVQPQRRLGHRDPVGVERRTLPVQRLHQPGGTWPKAGVPVEVSTRTLRIAPPWSGRLPARTHGSGTDQADSPPPFG